MNPLVLLLLLLLPFFPLFIQDTGPTSDRGIVRGNRRCFSKKQLRFVPVENRGRGLKNEFLLRGLNKSVVTSILFFFFHDPFSYLIFTYLLDDKCCRPCFSFVRSFIYNRIIPRIGSLETRWKRRFLRRPNNYARFFFQLLRLSPQESESCPATSIGIDGSRRIFSKDHGLCSLGGEENVPYKETWHLRKQSREIPTFLRLLVDENVNSQDLIKRFDWLTDESRSRLETS